MHHACAPCGLAGTRRHHEHLLTISRQHLRAGQTLYRKGDTFQRVNAVRIGSLKSSLTLADGRTQVCGFHLPGDVVGFDAVAHGSHPSTATALEDTQTCALGYGLLLDLSRRAAGRGRSPSELHLYMTRSDIGSYPGITAETVCRALHEFKALKVLHVDARHIRFVDLPAFARIYSATLHWRARPRRRGPLPVQAQVHAQAVRPAQPTWP